MRLRSSHPAGHQGLRGAAMRYRAGCRGWAGVPEHGVCCGAARVERRAIVSPRFQGLRVFMVFMRCPRSNWEARPPPRAQSGAPFGTFRVGWMQSTFGCAKCIKDRNGSALSWSSSSIHPRLSGPSLVCRAWRQLLHVDGRPTGVDQALRDMFHDRR